MRKLSLLLFFALLSPLTGMAETAEEKGLAIAIEADERSEGFADSTSSMTMILRNRHGAEVTRALRNRTLEGTDDGDKSMMIFDDPADVAGTALLTYSHKAEDDDQWLYLPALKRVKRISSSNKAGPFMGSEFAYEDLSSQEVEKYSYKYIKDETFDGRDHFVIERYPVDKKSGYTKQIVWLDQEEYRVFKIEYFDRKESLLKTLVLSDYELFLDDHWRPKKLDMVNHQTEKSTTLLFKDYLFEQGLEEKDFTKNSLTKIR